MTKHVLIVGGTRGTGREVVKRFLASNCLVSVIGRRPPPEKDSSKSNVKYYVTDITNDESLGALLNEVIERHNGKINSLVFLQRYRGDEDKWFGEIETTLTATKKIIERLVGSFDKNASIVIVSSNASHYVASDQTVGYHVGKAGLTQMARYYAAVLGEHGIRINVVSPNTILKEENKEFYENNEKLLKIFKETIPLKRMCTSEDVANAVEFLCSEKSSYITGHNLTLDGGASLAIHESLARKLKDG